MIKTEEVIIPAVPEKKETKETGVVCDICQVFFEGVSICGLETAFPKDYYRRVEVAVGISDIESYPSGGSSTALIFDICPNCFRDKVIPVLKDKFGVIPREINKDW
jgi:hypothetical protein